MFSLADPSAPAQSGTYVTSNIYNRLVFDDYMYLLTTSGLNVVDISDGMNPVTETTLSLPYSGLDAITRVEQNLIIAGGDHHPVFVDITDSTAPVIYGEPIGTDSEWPIRGLDSDGIYLYELCESVGVRIWELF